VEQVGVISVFLFALLTAVTTGLGAVPFAFAKRPTRRWLGASNAIAAGLMLAASFGLIYEGVNYGLFRTSAGALLGLGFIVLVRRFLRQEEHPAVFAGMGGLDAARRSRSSGS
jgi:ZIP family zinc transporter